MQNETAMRNALADEWENHINTTGSTNTGGHLVFQTSNAAADIIDMAGETAFCVGAAAAGQVSVDVSNLSGSASTDATLSQAEVRDRDETAVSVLGCGTSGTADFILSSTSISSGETLTVNSLTITVAAGSPQFT